MSTGPVYAWHVAGVAALTAQGFSRREREIDLESVDLLAREADGGKPLLARPTESAWPVGKIEPPIHFDLDDRACTHEE